MIPPGLYRGSVDGVESGPCAARMSVSLLPGGAVSVDYEAVSVAHGLQHAEHTLVTDKALYVAHSESAGVTVFLLNPSGAYDAVGPSPYALRIIVGWDGEVLTWAWHWAAAGEEPVEQSRATLRAVES